MSRIVPVTAILFLAFFFVIHHSMACMIDGDVSDRGTIALSNLDNAALSNPTAVKTTD